MNSDTENITFDEFAEFVRRWASVPAKKHIDQSTQFERDLGMTGDDGRDLLIASEQEFHVTLSTEDDGYRKTFNLGPHEYLFNAEGFGTIWAPITIFTASTVRAFTVGDLYDAVVNARRSRA